ncbi:hypothetical protein LTR97_001425 [Elasticomyces elasticus]|uniref:Uncharacterized protein n=1 Tax=Elasticomyces elasticus TaxID=574655 RepID=A0AAN7WHE8_9PEZI|nr:hypothetical protein LTR97_001425 [Elasticomyces elasticus]
MATNFHFPCLFCGKLHMHMNGTEPSCPAKIHHRNPDQPSHSVVEQIQQPTLTTAPEDTHEPSSTAQPTTSAPGFRPHDTASSPNSQTTKEALLQHVFRHGPITHPHLRHLTFTAANFDPKTLYDRRNPSHLNYVECLSASIICDELLFSANPTWISKGNLLRLAQNNSNSQIMQKANEDRSVKVLNSPQAVERRLKGAYKWSAEQNGVHSDVVKQWLKKTRTENGVGVRETRQKEIDETLGQLDLRVQG